jgi:hypothetical protein
MKSIKTVKKKKEKKERKEKKAGCQRLLVIRRVYFPGHPRAGGVREPPSQWKKARNGGAHLSS